MNLIQKYRKKSQRPRYRTKRLLYRYIKISIAFVLFAVIMTVNAFIDTSIMSMAFPMVFVSVFFYICFALYGSLSLRIRLIEEQLETKNRKSSGRTSGDD